MIFPLGKIEQSGLWTAGFVSYEASSSFDDARGTIRSQLRDSGYGNSTFMR